MTAVELAARQEASPIQAKAIAHNQSIPARFIEHVLGALRQAGLVSSVRGAQGGYRLRGEPAEVSLADIISAVNGTTATEPQNSAVTATNAPAMHEALLSDISRKLEEAELAILRSISLQTLVNRYQQLEDIRCPMYHI